MVKFNYCPKCGQSLRFIYRVIFPLSIDTLLITDNYKCSNCNMSHTVNNKIFIK